MTSTSDDSVEARIPGYRFGIVLLLLLATFMFLAIGATGAWTRPITVALQGATLIAAFMASGVSKTLMRIAIVIVAVSLVGSLASVLFDDSAGGGAAALLSVLLVALSPPVIALSISRRGVIDVHTVLGALCIYVLIGMLMAFAYTAIGTIGSQPFFSEHVTATTADYQYFSFVTLTTVGYGDLTAAGGLGRALAVLEALIGQIYLVTIVALLVANLGRGTKNSGSDAPG